MNIIDGTYAVMGGYRPKCPKCGETMERTFDVEIDDTKVNFQFECPSCGYSRPE